MIDSLKVSDQQNVENSHQEEESLFGSLLKGLWYNTEKQSSKEEQILNRTVETPSKDIAGKVYIGRLFTASSGGKYRNYVVVCPQIKLIYDICLNLNQMMD